MDTTKINGGCYCGKIRYSGTAEPLRSMVCHCQTCRRIAASPIFPWLIFAEAQFTFTRGVPNVFNSSEFVSRTFCSTCGTLLTYVDAQTPNEICVATCTLDDPELFPPTYHSWTSHDLSWLHVNDGLTAFSRSKFDNA